jgi:hypothetical protein
MKPSLCSVKSQKKSGNLLIILLFYLFFPSAQNRLTGQVPLYTLRTKNLRLIYYNKQHAYIIPHMARCFENSMAFHRQLFDYTPSEEVTVLLHDWNDYGTAGTNTIPWNYLNVGIEPYDYVYETSPTNERMNWVMNHELVHVLATDKAAGTDTFFRKLFWGKVLPVAENPLSMIYSYLTTPRWYSPRWYHEGIAVFMETWMSGGIGRAQNGYDEMVFRAMVNENCLFYDIVGLESEGTTIDFQIGVNSYLYGTRFVSYIAQQYGTDMMLQWFNRDRGSKRGFFRQFRNVYGHSLNKEWSKWIQWEHQWQHANLEVIRQNPVTLHSQICDNVLGQVSRACFDHNKNKVYVGINYPGQIAQIASIDIGTGEIKKICHMPTPALYYVTSLAYDPSENNLFFTTHNSTQWRNLNVVNINTGKTRLLIKGSRTGDLTFNPGDKSIWGVRHHNGYSILVRIPAPYYRIEEILPLKYGKDLFDIDISPDGSSLTGSLVEINGRQSLIAMELAELLKGNFSYDVLAEFEDNSPQNFVFSPDGKFLAGTSYYSGVSNVFLYNFENKTTDIITNCENGYFRPEFVSNDSLLVFNYTGEGFIPVLIPIRKCTAKAITFLGNDIAEKYPLVKDWKLNPPSPDLIDLNTLTIASGDYRSLKSLRIASVYPVVEGYKDYPAYGLRINLLDPLGGIDALLLTASYTPNQELSSDERFHLGFEYTHWNLTISGSYNGADFYDLFGPTKTSRKGYSLGLQYSNYLLYDKPRLLKYTINAAGYGGLEKLPDYQNVDASYDKLLTAGVGLHYSYLLRSLGAVEYERGVTWEIISDMNYVKNKLYPRFHANLDFGFLLPIHHSSIWFRNSIGFSIGDREEPFSNFYFGGFGNNWVDYQDFSRYRAYYSFPGVELNQFGGKNFGKASIEWTLPPVRFRRFGFPSMYFRWARLVLFSSGLVTNFDDKSFSSSYMNAGIQMDIRLVSFSIYKSTLSLGYAQAYSKDNKPFDEFMISFKIL